MNNFICLNNKAHKEHLSHLKKLLRTVSVLLLVLLAAAPFLTVEAVMAQSVNISISSAPPATEISISGTSFNEGDNYQIIFAPGTAYETLLAPTTQITGTGFSRTVSVPHVPRGQYNIRVASNRGNFFAAFPDYSVNGAQ